MISTAGNSEKEINGWHIRGTLIHHRIIELQHHHRLTLFIDQHISSVYILKEKERKRISFKKENHIYRLAVDEPCELTSWTSAIHGTFEVENIVVLPIELTLQPADGRILVCHFYQIKSDIKHQSKWRHTWVDDCYIIIIPSTYRWQKD